MDNYIKSEMDENDDDYDNDQVNSQNAEPVVIVQTNYLNNHKHFVRLKFVA